MFRTAYDTTVCAGYRLDEIGREIAKNLTVGSDQIRSVKWEGKPVNLSQVCPGLSVIKPFGHPVTLALDGTVINNKNFDDREADASRASVYIDVRNFARLNVEKELVITSFLDYRMAVIRGLLQLHWNGERFRDILNVGVLPHTLFVRWMTEILVKRLNLSPDVQLQVSVITAFYYLCLFEDLPKDYKLTEQELVRFSKTVSSATYCSVGEVMKRIEVLEIPQSIHCYLELLKKHSGSQRFDNIAVATIYQMLGGSWFGANASEMLAVALEHPPTWVAIAYMATEERGYKKTSIGSIAHDSRNTDAAKNFMINAMGLLNTIADHGGWLT